MKTSWFVYTYKDPRTDDFIYIGKGKYRKDGQAARAYHHWKNYKTLTNNLLRGVLYKIANLGLEPEILIESTHPTEASALKRECELIEQHGLRVLDEGPLCNMTWGGEGWGGQIWTDERKRKSSESIKEAYKNNPEYRDRLIALHADPTFKAERSKKIKLALTKPGMHEKLSNAIRKGQGKSDAVKKIAAASKTHWKDEEYRNKTLEAMLEAHQRPEVKRDKSETTRLRWKDPEYKARVSAAIKAGRSTEESRAKTVAQQSRQWTDENRKALRSTMKELYSGKSKEELRARTLKSWETRKKRIAQGASGAVDAPKSIS